MDSLGVPPALPKRRPSLWCSRSHFGCRSENSLSCPLKGACVRGASLGVILTRRRPQCAAGLISSQAGAASPPAQVGLAEWGACARAGGAQPAHRPRPRPAPCCPASGAARRRAPAAMVRAPTLVLLLLLGQLLAATAEQVSEGLWHDGRPRGSGPGSDVESRSRGRLRPSRSHRGSARAPTGTLEQPLGPTGRLAADARGPVRLSPTDNGARRG